MREIELLAPARDREAGELAVNCGADALYIGAPAFGARQGAATPLSEIEALIRYAHRYRVKVYAALNTLLFDHELPEAEQQARALCEMGIDALIIQDFAYLEMTLPPIPWIASTQMHNHNAESLQFLKASGFSRAILPRELSLSEIASLRANCSLPLEVFIHGALCVSYSGQCYLSRYYGKRSGNRGDCAQPCRTRFALESADGEKILPYQHLLSLKDLSHAKHLRALIDAGVSSLKIEGRLKDQLYLKNVVLYYRQLLDQILTTRPSSGRVETAFTPDLNKTFHRGYSDFYLSERHHPHPRLTAWRTPKWIGEPIGEVRSASGNRVVLKKRSDEILLHSGDGITFFDAEGELNGSTLNGVEGHRLLLAQPHPLAEGTPLYRNRDHLFLKALESARVERKIGVTMMLTLDQEAYRLSLTDEDGLSSEAVQEHTHECAHDSEKLIKTFETQLRKTGGSLFEVTQLTLPIEGTENATEPLPYLPISKMNALRRVALDALERRRETEFENRPLESTTPERSTPASATSRPLNRDGSDQKQVPPPTPLPHDERNITNRLAARFYQRHGVEKRKTALELRTPTATDRVMVSRYCLLDALGKCLRHHPSDQEYHLVDEQGERFQLRFDCEHCRMELYPLSSQSSIASDRTKRS